MTPTAIAGSSTAKACATESYRSAAHGYKSVSGVGVTPEAEALRGDLLEDADGQARAGEGVPPHQRGLHTGDDVQLPHLDHEEKTQRLNALQLHRGVQAAQVVIAWLG